MSLDIYLEAKVDLGGAEPHEVEIYWANITHNVGPMWTLAGCYEALYESAGKQATFVLPDLKRALTNMKDYPEKYKPLNPSNGWGSYESAMEFLSGVIDAFEATPLATIRVSR